MHYIFVPTPQYLGSLNVQMEEYCPTQFLSRIITPYVLLYTSKVTRGETIQQGSSYIYLVRWKSWWRLAKRSLDMRQQGSHHRGRRRGGWCPLAKRRWSPVPELIEKFTPTLYMYLYAATTKSWYTRSNYCLRFTRELHCTSYSKLSHCFISVLRYKTLWFFFRKGKTLPMNYSVSNVTLWSPLDSYF